jgi:hypothetical protein
VSVGSTSAPAASGKAITDLEELETRSATATKNLEGVNWDAQRKALSHDGMKYGKQQKY